MQYVNLSDSLQSSIPCPGCHYMDCQCASPDDAFLYIEEMGIFALPESDWPTWEGRLREQYGDLVVDQRIKQFKEESGA